MAELSMVQRRQEAARKQRADLQEKMGRRERTAKPQDGRSRWRILPSWKGLDELDVAHAWGQHFVKDAAGDLKAVHVCLKQTYGKDCPICDALDDAIATAHRAGDEETKKLLAESKSSSRYLLNAYEVKKGVLPEVVILELPPTVFEMINDLIDQKADEQEVEDDDGETEIVPGVDMLDPKKGFDVMITRTGKGLNTKYTVNCVTSPTRVPPELLEKLHDLDAYVKQEHAETEMKALNVVNTVASGRALPSPSKAGVLDADDDDILDGEFEEEEPKPKAKAKAAPKSKAPTDQEIDDLLGDLDDLDLDD